MHFSYAVVGMEQKNRRLSPSYPLRRGVGDPLTPPAQRNPGSKADAITSMAHRGRCGSLSALHTRVAFQAVTPLEIVKPQIKMFPVIPSLIY